MSGLWEVCGWRTAALCMSVGGGGGVVTVGGQRRCECRGGDWCCECRWATTEKLWRRWYYRIAHSQFMRERNNCCC